MATEARDMMGNAAAIRPALHGIGRWLDVSDREREGALSKSGRAQDRASGGLALVPEIDTRTGGIVGASAALQVVLARARKVALTDSTVLVTGETGTGKELLARAIHMASRRAAGPFVSVNCAAIPQTLIASELFGHERGAFTGASQRRHGRFELAAGGTLFLDEVGELPVETQVLLLRVLQEREFERLGGATSLSADVRVVAATSRALRQAMADGSFRSDLYYRLAVFPLEMPPLREREGDIRLLAEHFVRRSARKVGKTIRAIDPGALAQLEAYSWPGNVRELQNVIECSVILCESETFNVDPGWLQSDPALDAPKRHGTHAGETESAEPNSVPQPGALQSTLDGIQREAILRALQSCGWIIGGPKGAAALLGFKRTTLQARMQKLGIATQRHALIGRIDWHTDCSVVAVDEANTTQQDRRR